MSDILITKGQEQDRVQRRLEKYRARHEESIPRFEHTLNGINEQQKQETLLLRQRFLEPRAKKSSKKTDKKGTLLPTEIQTTNTGPKASKRDRGGDEIISNDQQQNGHENKLGHSNGTPSPTYKKRKSEAFPPENVQQVKNGSTLNPVSNLKLNSKESPVLPPTQPNRYGVPVPPPLKQETNNHVSNFADLDQCAAALEKDGTTSMGLMEGGSDGLIPSDTLKDLIFEISDLNPDFMGDFDFDEDRHAHSTNEQCFPSHYHHHTAPVTPASVTFSPRNIKIEDGPSPVATSTASPLPHPSQTPPQASSIFDSSSPNATIQNHSTSRSSTPNSSYGQQTTSPSTGSAKSIRMPYESPTNMGHDSPAAQTLKHLAQQHQQSNPPARSPFGNDPYSPLSGDFVSNGPAGSFRSVRCHSGDAVIVKQENPPPGIYGACPNYPRSPGDLMALNKKSKVSGHSKSFTQAHLNPNPQLPPSYRNSFSPPTSSFPSNTQQLFMQHKINQSPQMSLQQQQQHPAHQIGIGGDLKGVGLPISHHQPFPGSQYYQPSPSEGCFPGAQQDKGQTINFTQQHLRLSQSGHSQQQPMGRMAGLSNPGQQPILSHVDRSRPPLRLTHGGLELNEVGTRMPLEVQHRLMMRDGISNEIGRFNNGNCVGSSPQGNQRLTTHRHQLMNDTGYHHQPMSSQHMTLPPRRHVPCQLPPQDGRIPNLNQAHSQHHDNWHGQSTLPEHVRSFHPHQHFHTPGVNQQQFVANHSSGYGSYANHPNQRLLQPTKMEGEMMGSSEEGGVVLKTETDSSEFNLILEGMGDDYSFDPSYQNILDTF